MTALQGTHAWHKSSYSANAGDCVEARHGRWGAEIRDTKNRAAGTVAFSAVEWTRFLASATGR